MRIGEKVLKYPETEQKEVVDIIHGKEIKDPYRWLENYEDPKVIEWLEKQNQNQGLPFTWNYFSS